MPDTFVLDAQAILALVTDEPGANRVATTLQNPDIAARISTENVGKVYYTLLRRRGEAAADQVERSVFEQQNLVVVEATWERIRAAARIKADGGISFADAFAAALAQELSAPLLTGDPEFEKVARRGTIQVEWLTA